MKCHRIFLGALVPITFFACIGVLVWWADNWQDDTGLALVIGFLLGTYRQPLTGFFVKITMKVAGLQKRGGLL